MPFGVKVMSKYKVLSKRECGVIKNDTQVEKYIYIYIPSQWESLQDLFQEDTKEDNTRRRWAERDITLVASCLYKYAEILEPSKPVLKKLKKNYYRQLKSSSTIIHFIIFENKCHRKEFLSHGGIKLTTLAPTA